MDRIEELVCDTVDRCLADPDTKALIEASNPVSFCQQQIKNQNNFLFVCLKGFKPPKRPFKRMTYSEAIEWLRAHNIDNADGKAFEFGEDIPEGPERKMTDAINEVPNLNKTSALK